MRGTIFRGNVSGGEGWGRATTRVAPTGGGEGDGSPHPRGQRRGKGGSRTASTECKNVGVKSIVAVYLRGNDGHGDVKKAGRNCQWASL